LHVLWLYRANEEIAKVKRTNESEMVVLQAALRKAEMQAQSLEQTVEQKASQITVAFCFTRLFMHAVCAIPMLL